MDTITFFQTTLYKAKAGNLTKTFRSERAAKLWIIKAHMYQIFVEDRMMNGAWIGKYPEEPKDDIFTFWMAIKPGFFYDAQTNGIEHAEKCLRHWLAEDAPYLPVVYKLEGE